MSSNNNFTRLYHSTLQTNLPAAHALVDYEDVIPAETIYAIIALTATIARSFGTCSNAFIKLENVENEESRTEYEQLAVEIFTRYPPRDSRTQKVTAMSVCLSVCAGTNISQDWKPTSNFCYLYNFTW